MPIVKLNKTIITPIILLPIWYLIYINLQPATDWLVDIALGLNKGDHLTESLRFFIFEFPKVLMLLVLIIFFVGILRSFFTAERTRKALEGKSTFVGNIMAGTLGIVTPFVLVRLFRFFWDLWNRVFHWALPFRF